MSLILSYPVSPLALRPITITDAPALHQLAVNPEVSQYLNWSPPACLDETLKFLDQCAQTSPPQHFAVLQVPQRTVIGMSSFITFSPETKEAEMGTWLGQPYWGLDYNLIIKGIMFYIAFSLYGLKSVLLQVKTENTRSIRSLKKLPGLEFIGIKPHATFTKERYWDQARYRMTASAWSQATSLHFPFTKEEIT